MPSTPSTISSSSSPVPPLRTTTAASFSGRWGGRRRPGRSSRRPPGSTRASPNRRGTCARWGSQSPSAENEADPHHHGGRNRPPSGAGRSVSPLSDRLDRGRVKHRDRLPDVDLADRSIGADPDLQDHRPLDPRPDGHNRVDGANLAEKDANAHE